MLNNSESKKDFFFLSLLVTLSTICRFWLSYDIKWVNIPDSAWYASSAQSFWGSLRLLMGGAANTHTVPLYSIFISPAYFFNNIDSNFMAIKLINAFVMSSAAIPVYFLARQFISLRNAKIAAVLSIMIGAMFYTFTIMPANLHYPLVAWSIYLTWRSIREEKHTADILLGLVWGLALLNKMSSLILPACYVATTFFFAYLDKAKLPGRGGERSLSEVIKKQLYVFAAVVLVILPYLVLRKITAGHGSAVPYGYMWAQYIDRLRQIDVVKLLKWFLCYIGELNLSTGLFLLVPSVLMAWRTAKSRDWNLRFFGLFALILIAGVLALASFQSGYAFGRLTERHFFILSPLVLILFLRWLEENESSDQQKAMSYAITSVFILLSTGFALFTPSWTSNYAADSAFRDSLDVVIHHSSGLGVGAFVVKFCLFFSSMVLTTLVYFARAKRVKQFSIVFVSVFFMLISVAPYSSGGRQLETLRQNSLPIVQWINGFIKARANLIFLNVHRGVVLDYIIWNKDIEDNILWQARTHLEDPSSFRFHDLKRIRGLLNPRYDTYIISPFFDFEKTKALGNAFGLNIYQSNSPRATIAFKDFHVDFGAPNSRQVLQDGWSGNEGPYPSMNFPTFVWATGKSARIIFYVDKITSKELSFFAMSPVPKQSIQFAINGIPAGTLEMVSGWNEYRHKITSSLLKLGENKLVFSFGDAIGPSKSDSRRLAVAFDWLRIGELGGFNIDFGTSASRAFLRKGWSMNEGPYPAMDFPTFVWAIGHQSELNFFQDGGLDKILFFRAITPFASEQSLTIQVNGKEVATLNMRSGWNEYSAELPSQVLEAGNNRLKFLYKIARSPAEDGGKDTRKLAVAFDWLKIEDNGGYQ